jgi:hypothetical protein
MRKKLKDAMEYKKHKVQTDKEKCILTKFKYIEQ